ncbi:MAG: PhoX family phosphatase, partial [Thiobacillaceae bacterium]|nr:PhoX family phosphatase [Thiobacillaceae bacterium]
MSNPLHPDSRLDPCLSCSNESGNPTILDIIEQRLLDRRQFFKLSAGAMASLSALSLVGCNDDSSAAETTAASSVNPGSRSPSPTGGIGFASVRPNVNPMTDAVTVPQGYTARVLIAWGDSLTPAPHWDPTGAMDEATQLRCYGAHTDGMHFFPFSDGSGPRSDRGLLVANHEYVDPPLLNNAPSPSAYNALPAGTGLTLAMVRAEQAAHGVSVVEVAREGGSWVVKRDSPYNRRITANTPCRISGPAAGHPLMRTDRDTSGTYVLGTLNNCAHGYTPWGTYLTCEENWNLYFGATGTFTQNDHERRYGVATPGSGERYRWHEVDPRFDVNAPGNRNEPNRFGWVVEIDPWNPDSTPVKRTALGRFKHEGAWVVVGPDNFVAVYMGDDERNEYIYKFVCKNKYNPNNLAANRNLLDEGTLYVARFNADGSGEWIALVHGQNGLTAANGFADQGEVLIKCRQAADRVGATMMDRPEWGAVHPQSLEVYMTLTNNNRRGSNPASSNNPAGTTPAGSARPPVDRANPRPDNVYGHIIRWREQGGRVEATRFNWDVFVNCGDKNTSKTFNDTNFSRNNFIGVATTDPDFAKKLYAGNINGDDYGAPDGLWFDKDGRLWIQTDHSTGLAQGDYVNI